MQSCCLQSKFHYAVTNWVYFHPISEENETSDLPVCKFVDAADCMDVVATSSCPTTCKNLKGRWLHIYFIVRSHR